VTVRRHPQSALRGGGRLRRNPVRRKGLEAPLEEIAREAGSAIGTFYDRFSSRGELADAALGPLAQQAMELAERAARAEDPWQGVASLVEDTCALFAGDRGNADAYRSSIPGTPVIAAAQQRLAALKATVVTRAKHARVLRADVALGVIGGAGVPVQLAVAGRAVAWTGSATGEASQSGIPQRNDIVQAPA
jgi:AcrR family transcriptional regulator